MTNNIVLITGANSGIGWETVKALLESPKSYHILFGCRSTEKGQTALQEMLRECLDTKSTVELLEVDLTSDASIEAAAKLVGEKHGRVDTLVNNAGATFDLEFLAGKVTLRECFIKACDVNLAGTHIMTWNFVPLLLKSTDPRLIFLSGLSHMNQASEKYFPTPPQPAGWPKDIHFETIGYRCSKVGLNMLMLDWNHKLKADGVKVWALQPGILATNLGNVKELAVKFGAKHPSLGGQYVRDVIEGQQDELVGKHVSREGAIPF
ncbi:hypothetical protein PROFUN_09908 [Planoprotostelium fungivorum]|uniref:Uncharacterized protein n=1 Tax=Planoprotostelium fungivorum TaxID=1890364 RepID=A0A2P6NGH3_9EUKA|nr:hypothetical protein PROFUN_09908 [Planoprotostelium fungivorum]